MAGHAGTSTDSVDPLLALAQRPEEFSFFEALRRLECAARDKPRLGTAARPSEEPVRIGQEPSLGFAPSSLSKFVPAKDGKPAQLSVLFQGFFGPNGPLPIHFTEYARDRLRNSADPTFARFADIFHHRLLSLFYRAWAQAQPVVSFDRPETDRFATYSGALFGGVPVNVQQHSGLDFTSRLFFAGHLSAQTKNPGSLAALLTAALGVQAEIHEFVGEWVSLPAEARWKLGHSSQPGMLGVSATLGARAWMVQHKFRVVLGPLPPGGQREYLPGSERLSRVAQLVASYVGDELRWDLKLKLRNPEATRLGISGNLGWTAFLTQQSGREDNSLILEPQRPVSPGAQMGV
ncbi:MAG: type VI secretion system baseplate subunit TssG [Deltaproteobacteria bacterium]|nr:type VI secretion system baseplate subunit TssG [Deltaproteobacteria bacterium]